jgi:hypothetical protein
MNSGEHVDSTSTYSVLEQRVCAVAEVTVLGMQRRHRPRFSATGITQREEAGRLVPLQRTASGFPRPTLVRRTRELRCALRSAPLRDGLGAGDWGVCGV